MRLQWAGHDLATEKRNIWEKTKPFFSSVFEVGLYDSGLEEGHIWFVIQICASKSYTPVRLLVEILH